MERRYNNLDVLRLFLALAVLVHHYFFFKMGKAIWLIPTPVTAFVCLSGFLIPASFERSRSYGHFAWKRALRVIPVFLVSFVLVGGLLGADRLWPTFLGYVTLGLIAAGSANGVLWSLSLEEVLYGYHAFSRKVRALWTPALVFALFAFLCLVSRLLKTSPEINRLLETAAGFFLGNIAYFYRKKLSDVSWEWYLALLLAAFVALHSVPDWQVLVRQAICVIVMLLAMTLPQLKWQIPDLSYSAYAFHIPLYLGVIAPLQIAPWPGFALLLGLTLGLGLLSWYLVERPSLKLKNARLGSRRASDLQPAKVS